MITCPTCGNAVPANQRFCGNCGTDVQAASTFAQAENNPAPDAPPADAAYGYEPNQYSYGPAQERRPSMTVIALMLAGVALVCLCCGIVLGAAGWYLLGPVATPPPPTPTPEGLLHLILML